MKLPEVPSPLPVKSGPAVPDRKRERRALVAASVIALAGSILVLVQHQQRGADRALEATARANSMARQILAAFLAARTPEERATFVRDGERLLPVMQAYYAGREVESFSADDFQPPPWEFNTGGTGLVALEFPRSRGLSTVVACFKETSPGQWFIDWDVWIQTVDARFRDFIRRASEGEYPMHVRLTTSEVSASGIKMEIADPFNPSERMKFEITRKDLVEFYSATLPKGQSRTATVELVWLNDSRTGTLLPIIRRHICWGFRGLDESLNAPPAAPPTPNLTAVP